VNADNNLLNTEAKETNNVPTRHVVGHSGIFFR